MDTNTDHNATVCVDFVKKDTLMGTSFVEIFFKKLLPVYYFATKLLATSTRFITSVLSKKVSLKVQGLLKFKHFDSLVTNFGPVLPNSRKRLRNVCHAIGEINIILFLRLVLQQWA